MLKEFASIMFRWKREILAVAAIIVLFTIVSVYTQPPSYESQAMILVVPGRDKRPFIPDQNTSNIQTYFQVSLEDIANEVQIILSYPVLKAVVDKLHLDAAPSGARPFPARVAAFAGKAVRGALVAVGLKRSDGTPEETAVSNLKSGLHIDFVKRTAIITLSYRASTPEQARDVVNALVDAYITHHLTVYSNAGAATAMQSIGEDFKTKLHEKEDTLKEFKTRKGVVDMDLEHQEIEKKLTEAQAKLPILQRINVNRITTADLANLSDDPAFAQLQTRLTDAELRLLELTSRYGKGEGKVIAAEKEVSELKQFIGNRVKVSIESWKQLIAQYQERFSLLEHSSIRISRLEREITAIKDAIEISAQKSNEMVINSYLDNAAISSIRVVEYGHASSKPVAPKRASSILISLILGPLFGVLYAFGRNRLSSSLFSLHDVESVTHKPVAASIQEFESKTAASSDDNLMVASRILVPVADHVRKEQNSLTLITSPSVVSGTSFVAASLSIPLAAQSGHRVLWAEILPPEHDARSSRKPHFYFTSGDEVTAAGVSSRIGAGPCKNADALKVVMPSTPALDREQIAHFVTVLRSLNYSHLVVDISAHRADPLYLSFAAYATAIYIVVAYGKTNRYSLLRMINILDRNGYAVDGCIFNRRVNVIPESLYQWL